MQAQVSCEIIHFFKRNSQQNVFLFLINSFRNVDNYVMAGKGISHTGQKVEMPPVKIESERQKRSSNFSKTKTNSNIF